MPAKRHVTLPQGFSTAGVACGIKASGKEDLAIFAADRDASVAMVTTTNQVVGAPVIYSRRVLPRGYGRIRGVVVNAGNSNVCTGPGGVKDAEIMAKLTARALGASPEKILVASTGVIGHRLPMPKVRKGIAAAAGALGRRDDGPALRAIMTTDLREKSAVVRLRLEGRTVTIAGIAKGSGMIAPSLATMISIITTDAAVSPAALARALREATSATFNAVTVDSDTSTSDTVIAMASGVGSAKPMTSQSPAFAKFRSALREVCWELARAIAADGEGATKLIRVKVTGAGSPEDARIAAKAVANSPLFKCAVHGQDPNWGRIVMALGKSNARVEPDSLRVKVGPTTVFARGRGKRFDANAVSRYLGRDEVEITCDLGLGQGNFEALTCDLSREYITINADYHT
jgi:glutamate N-acetyltransferase / amino-acid N-acetyltransferase